MQSSACSSQAISCWQKSRLKLKFLESLKLSTHLTLFAAIPLTRASSTHEKCFILLAALTQQVCHVLNATTTAVVKVFSFVNHQRRFHWIVFVFLRVFLIRNIESLSNFIAYHWEVFVSWVVIVVMTDWSYRNFSIVMNFRWRSSRWRCWRAFWRAMNRPLGRCQQTR